MSQLRKLGTVLARRRELVQRYTAVISDHPGLRPLAIRPGVDHAWHLYVVRLEPAAWRADRATVYCALRAEGIGVGVHYKPVYWHPFYQARLGAGPGLCPVTEAAYETILTLPLYPAMSDGDADDVLRAVAKVTEALAE
jgi:perosamine synthetase